MYLLDTNVISELRRQRPHGAVLAWLRSAAEDQLYVAAVTLFELQAGVEITRRRDAARAAELEAWIDTVPQTFEVLAAGDKIFRRAAQLLSEKSPDLLGDGLIAATALVHNLTVVTRNLRDFAHFEVPTLDPFQA